MDKTNWTFFPLFYVRTTGFSFDLLSKLRHLDTHQAVVDFLCLESELNTKRQDFLNRLFSSWVQQAEMEKANRSVFRALYRLRKRVRQSKEFPSTQIDESIPNQKEIQNWLTHWNECVGKCQSARENIATRLIPELEETRTSLRRLTDDPRLQEALFLCSPELYEEGLKYYHRHFQTQSRPNHIKKMERKLYSYLQRFCAKNETASFFGPMDYGKLDATDPVDFILERHPDSRLQKRLSRLSHWATQALADRISAEPSLLDHLVPRLPYDYCLSKDGRLQNLTESIHLSTTALESELLFRANGLSTVKDICDNNESRIKCLSGLVKKGFLILTIEVPTSVYNPLDWLCDQLKQLPGTCSAREIWLERLRKLQLTIKQFAYENVEEKSATLKSVENWINAWTGIATRRGQGEIYADRTLLFDEAQGDITRCVLGKKSVQKIDQALRPIMDLSATYSLLVQRVYHRLALDIFKKMNQGSAVSFSAFSAQVNKRIQLKDCLQDTTIRSYLERLNAFARDRVYNGEIRIDEHDLSPFLSDIPLGTFVSPDIFLAASSQEDLHNGSFSIYLGEIHYGFQAWSHLSLFLEDHSDWESVMETTFPKCPSDTIRANKVLTRRHGKVFYPELPGYSYETNGRSSLPRERVLPASDLEVTLRNDRLALRYQGKWVDVYPDDRHTATNWLFGTPPVIVAPIQLGAHTPRIRLGEVVFQRELWNVDVSTWSKLIGLSGSELMLESERLRQQHEIPKQCFATLAGQPKAFFMDFSSLFCLEFFISKLGGCSALFFNELLPNEHDHWFTRDDGRYSCEFRLTAITSS